MHSPVLIWKRSQGCFRFPVPATSNKSQVAPLSSGCASGSQWARPRGRTGTNCRKAPATGAGTSPKQLHRQDTFHFCPLSSDATRIFSSKPLYLSSVSPPWRTGSPSGGPDPLLPSFPYKILPPQIPSHLTIAPKAKESNTTPFAPRLDDTAFILSLHRTATGYHKPGRSLHIQSSHGSAGCKPRRALGRRRLL